MPVPERQEIITAAERGDLDTVLRLVSLEEIADAWWRYTRRCAAALAQDIGAKPDWDTDPDAWASELWHEDVLQSCEETVRAFLHTLAKRAPGDVDLGFMGAGPIEDFASNESRLLWIEHEAAQSPNFRAALANVYPGSDLDEDQNARLRRAAEGA